MYIPEPGGSSPTTHVLDEVVVSEPIIFFAIGSFFSVVLGIILARAGSPLAGVLFMLLGIAATYDIVSVALPGEPIF
jgi:hypothetical protein